MKIKCISCDALARPVYHCAARSPHTIDITLISLGQHIKPKQLGLSLQTEIDRVDGRAYDAVVLCYGLCGQATAGLQARDLPLVIPRAHDCITLYLGDRAAYQAHQKQHPGTLWYSKDYIERGSGSEELAPLGAAMDMNSQESYDACVKQFGKERADTLMKAMGKWLDHYERAVFIDQGLGDHTAELAKTREEAAGKGWRFEIIPGNLRLIEQLLSGQWDEEDFLVVRPGQKITMGFGEKILTAADQAP